MEIYFTNKNVATTPPFPFVSLSHHVFSLYTTNISQIDLYLFMETRGFPLNPEPQLPDNNFQYFSDSSIPLGKGMAGTSNCPLVANLYLILDEFVI